MNIRPLTFFALTCAFISMAGCSMFSSPSPDIGLFLPKAQRPLKQVTSPEAPLVSVRRFSASPACTEKGFMYKTGSQEVKADFYNRFLIRPADLVTDSCRNWLWDSGAFRDNNLSPDGRTPEGILTGELISCYVDVSASRPTAVWQIRVRLTRPGKDTCILLERTYRSETTAAAKSAAAFADAWDKGLTEILTEIESDMLAAWPGEKEE